MDATNTMPRARLALWLAARREAVATHWAEGRKSEAVGMARSSEIVPGATVLLVAMVVATIPDAWSFVTALEASCFRDWHRDRESALRERGR